MYMYIHVLYVYVSVHCAVIDLNNDLLSVWYQAITWTSAGILLT